MVYTEVVYTVEVVDGFSSSYAPALTAAATQRRERTDAFILRSGRLILKIEV
jgi:ATP-dependent 26S proteasome regulatory subunit